MIDQVSNILQRCGSDDSVLPPTELYNEGWMLCLVLDWLDRNRNVDHPLSFETGARWFSQGLLPSRFLPTARVDSKAEAYTHADGVIGHFDINPDKRGDITLQSGARQFVVIEAKLGSGLSAGTRNAPTFDQAARNVACMAHMLANASIIPASVVRLAFFVIAPDEQIRSGVFADLVTKENIKKKVNARVDEYQVEHDTWFEETFLPTLEKMEVSILAWERVLADLPSTPESQLIRTFYDKCIVYNRLIAKKG